MSDRTFRTTGSLAVEPDIDLEACHTDPIHRFASIQGHGTFLQVDPQEKRVLSVAANVADYLDRPADDVVGASTAALFDRGFTARIEHWPRGGRSVRERLVHEGATGRLSVTLFPVGDTSGMEIERAPSGGDVPEELMINARPTLDRLRGLDSREELFGESVRAVRRVSGFDRVMMYRFDEEGHGSVVAEDRRDDVKSYLGQHFPASDIPEPARRLYRTNGIRYIPDVDYAPVAITGPQGKRRREELDLTHSFLRGVPEVHRQYLRNMGVGSSLSVAVVAEGELWGLIACHGVEARRIGWARRSLCELIGSTVSQQIERLRAGEERRRRQSVHRLEDRLESPTDHTDLFEQLRSERSRLLSLVDATAFYLRFAGQSLWLAEDGSSEPPEGLVEHASSQLDGRKSAAVRSIAGELDDRWEHSERFSGLLAVRLGHSPRHFCAWFRPEHRESIEWGGDPRQPARVDPEGGLSPRDSFEAWTQIVSGRAPRWTDMDRITARELAKLLDEMFIEVQSHRLQRVNQQLTERNAALEQAKSSLEEANARREELLEEMKELARTDELTGLANRRELMRRLDEEVDRARRYGNSLSLAILDLDRFKDVNDRHGHQVGDRVLRRVGKLLEEQTRSPDVAGRYGGEEFGLVLPESAAEEAVALSERILERIRDLTFEVDGRTFGITASVGVAELRDGEEPTDRLIRTADEALYRAKEEGRDRVVAG